MTSALYSRSSGMSAFRYIFRDLILNAIKIQEVSLRESQDGWNRHVGETVVKGSKIPKLEQIDMIELGLSVDCSKQIEYTCIKRWLYTQMI